MRKYTQLGLVVVCLVSVVGLLIMERQYSNMKVFLEVADIFQASETNQKCIKKLEALRSSLEGEFLESTHKVDPSWKQTEASTFFYSAFYSTTNAKVTILMVSDRQPDTCVLWTDPETLFNSKPSIRILETFNNLSAMAVECPFNNNKTLTPGVAELLGNLIPIEDQVVTEPDGVSLCIQPLNFNTTEMRLTEFLTYHNSIGIERFFIYDESLAPKTKTFLRRAPFIQNTMMTHLLQWNPPAIIGQLSEAVLRADCLLRAGLYNKHVTMFSVNEFFALRRDMANLTSFISTVLRDDQVLAVHERIFCDEYPDDVIAEALNFPFITLRKTRYAKNTKEHRVTFLLAGDLSGVPRALHSVSHAEKASYISEETAHVNVYTSCSQMHLFIRKKNLQTPTDTYLTRYRDILFGSKLYKHRTHRISTAYDLVV